MRARARHPSTVAVLAAVFLFTAVALCAHGDGAAPRPVKVRVSNRAVARAVLASGEAKLVADYGGFQLLETDAATAEAIQSSGSGEIRQDWDAIKLNAGWIHTTSAGAKATSVPLQAFEGKRLHLVQFVGPIQGPWYEALLATGVRVVAYIPSNAYLVYGDKASLDNVRKLNASKEFMQWQGAYEDAYKVDPSVRSRLERGNADENLYAIQLVKDPAANASTRMLVEKLELSPTEQEYEISGYVNLVVRLPKEAIPELVARPDVISIQTYREPVLADERQDMIEAGQISGSLPSGPGYLAWLASKGFTQEQFTASGFGVDVSDDGVDNATTSPTHFGLYVGGVRPGTSRVMYARREGRPTPGTLKGCHGHGNLNAHIVAGYAPDGPPYDAFPFADDLGYRYGLGVCPFVKVGSSVIADYSGGGWFYPDYTKLQSDAYQDGARISTNSWGLWGDGRYSADSQAYDALVRDAQPAGSSHPADGNQEMVIVFCAMNYGPSARTVGDPATAKNVIAAAASENVRAFGGDDACGRGDSMADNATDIAVFSSRGPCKDGRIKPDFAAPGSHITGGVFQADSPPANGQADPCYDGSTICGGPGGSVFWPLGQQWYTASSGTSHSTPAISGGAALLRQYFINAGMTPPSPSMTKAYLMNSARYLTGEGANDTLWSTSQGMGLMDLGAAFDGTSRLLRDQMDEDLFTATGQTRTFNGVVGNASLPFRATLAWTDAPGSTTGAAYCNDLDLTVTVGGQTYKGNVFSGATSVTGGAADDKDNVESVFLPAGLSGDLTVTVRAANINSDSVPNTGGPLDQDFALVVYNARVPDVTPPTISSMQKAGSPFRFVVTGTNLQSGIQVFIGSDTTPWPTVTWTSTTNLEIGGGKALKKKVPKNTPTQFKFLNPDGGESTLTWQWP